MAEATLAPLLRGDGDPDSITVCDPAVGGGALLLATARTLIAHGASPTVVAGHLAGMDTDPAAVAVAIASIELLTGSPPANIVVGDALSSPAPPGGPFDVVITNPPFLGQLKRGTVRSRDEAAVLTQRFGDAAGGYADSAGLFLLRSLDLARVGGRVGIILPAPLFATRDGQPIRSQVGERSCVDRLWSPPAAAFDAGVRVQVAILDVGGSVDGPWREGAWSLLSAGGDGAEPPDPALRSAGVLGDIATVAADFRDQYYGAAAVAVDDPDGPGPRLVTCGLIDPALLRWGTRPARLSRRTWDHPRADLARLDPRLRPWAAERLTPKVLLATQTRILEAIVDEEGDLLPVVPVISVCAASDRLWHALAVLLAPPVAAHARRLHAGAALSADAIKLSARQVAALPLPIDLDSWDEGAAAAKAATTAGGAGDAAAWSDALDHLGRVMCAAYDLRSLSSLAWWAERLARIQVP